MWSKKNFVRFICAFAIEVLMANVSQVQAQSLVEIDSLETLSDTSCEGKYGSYGDWSNFEELILHENGTFEYVIQETWQHQGAVWYSGKWTKKRKRIVFFDIAKNLSDFEHELPLKWKWLGDELCPTSEYNECLRKKK